MLATLAAALARCSPSPGICYRRHPTPWPTGIYSTADADAVHRPLYSCASRPAGGPRKFNLAVYPAQHACDLWLRARRIHSRYSFAVPSASAAVAICAVYDRHHEHVHRTHRITSTSCSQSWLPHSSSHTSSAKLVLEHPLDLAEAFGVLCPRITLEASESSATEFEGFNNTHPSYFTDDPQTAKLAELIWSKTAFRSSTLLLSRSRCADPADQQQSHAYGATEIPHFTRTYACRSLENGCDAVIIVERPA